MTDKGKVNHEGILMLEQSLLKTSLEQLKRSSRNSQKWVEKGLGGVSEQVNLLSEKEKDRRNAKIRLEGLVGKMEGIRRKLVESKLEEKLYASKCRARLDCLNEIMGIESVNSDSFSSWNRKRLYRLLVDYLLRSGFHKSAVKLTESSGSSLLSDVELMLEARQIEESLANGSCTQCLSWCLDNKSALKKAESQLEFHLRLQEYVELVRAQKLGQAMVYLRKHFKVFAASSIGQIQEASALLVYNPHSVDFSGDGGKALLKYRYYFEPERWQNLILTFRKDFYQLAGLSRQAQLIVSLQAGLSALKTPFCYDKECYNVNCPVCDSRTYGQLAAKLPNAHHVNSCTVCRISGEIMNEDNPPMVLPNGMVYSQKALLAISESRDDDMVEDPRTRQLFDVKSLRKVHVLT